MEPKKQSKKMGRPVGTKKANPMTSKILVQVTPEKLEAYKQASLDSGNTFSLWVREALDVAVKKSKGKK